MKLLNGTLDTAFLPGALTAFGSFFGLQRPLLAATLNAMAHRDYKIVNPIRVTVFVEAISTP